MHVLHLKHVYKAAFATKAKLESSKNKTIKKPRKQTKLIKFRRIQKVFASTRKRITWSFIFFSFVYFSSVEFMHFWRQKIHRLLYFKFMHEISCEAVFFGGRVVLGTLVSLIYWNALKTKQQYMFGLIWSGIISRTIFSGWAEYKLVDKRLEKLPVENLSISISNTPLCCPSSGSGVPIRTDCFLLSLVSTEARCWDCFKLMIYVCTA